MGDRGPIQNLMIRVRELDPSNLEQEAATVADLAKVIWTEHYTPMIGAEQVSYMLGRFQSAAQIREDIEQRGFRYWLAEDGQEPVGYCGAVAEAERLFLSKLYILHDHRGRGVGRRFLGQLEQWCCEAGLPRIQLTVHKANADSIRAYEHFGFTNVADIEASIGEGFIMDDYLLDKPVHKTVRQEDR